MALHSTIPTATIESSWALGKTPPSEGLHHTVSFIQTELRALNVRKEQLSERITTIKQIVIGLSQVFGSEVLNKQLLGVQFCETRVRHRGRHKRRKNPALSRACRIALLEHAEFMSENEVYSRIVRRGSFTFANTHLPAGAVVYELNLLCEHKQARFIEIGNERRWQRITPTNESEPSILLTNGAR